MLHREMQQPLFSVPPQIGGRDQPAVVVLGGLQSLIAVVAVGNEFECFGVSGAALAADLLNLVSLLENGLDKFASVIVKLVPDKVGNFKIGKTAFPNQPAKVRRRNCFLRVKGAAVESPVQLLINVLIENGVVVVVVVAASHAGVLSDLTFRVGRNFVGPGGVILNAKSKVVGCFAAAADTLFFPGNEGDKTLHTALDNFVHQVSLGPGKFLGGQVKIKQVFFGYHELRQAGVGVVGASGRAVRDHGLSVQVIARGGHAVLENEFCWIDLGHGLGVGRPKVVQLERRTFPLEIFVVGFAGTVVGVTHVVPVVAVIVVKVQLCRLCRRWRRRRKK